ncbi:hypothetical protein [Brachybacterium atlanticum]|uniref:hypothetical protein n=1 Tax=Brachybacterium atlanticum TaxID=2911888 RepID=UPI0021E0B1C2|nr:hypothetical protein [Brachybacterium atlanticum]
MLLVVAGLYWLIPTGNPKMDDPSRVGSTDVAVLTSDGGTDQPTVTEAPTTSAVTDAPAPTGDRTDPEQVAREFMTTYPRDIREQSDPTFLASLDGVDTAPLDQVTDLKLDQAGHASDETHERYAYTVTGTYQGQVQAFYSMVVARPAEPGEGGGAAENDLPFQVHSFDWAPGMIGDEDSPGPAAGKPVPITTEEREELIGQVRTDVIDPILTFDPDESPEQRQERLDELTVEPSTVTPPMSRSGRYAMITETLSQTYSTEHGGPITITYAGTWVDPYDPTHNGSWSLTAAMSRTDERNFVVHNVDGPAPFKSGEQD